MKKNYLILLFVCGCFQVTFGNNISVANVSLTDQMAAYHYCNVKFDLGWENSWRMASVPGNWDAAWIFVKFRVNGGVWQHATLSNVAGDHTAAAGSTINPSPDGKGVFIYRTYNGSGTNNWTNIKIRWEYGTDGVADDAMTEVMVFGVEMVYIPEGPFYIGDGDELDESTYAFHTGYGSSAVFIDTTLSQDIQVDPNIYDDPQIMYGGIGIDGDGGIDTDDNGTIDYPDFPTGYKAFYMMKYEMSQEQYVDFLNSLTRTQQASRVASSISGSVPENPYVMSNTSGVLYRNGIRSPADISGSDPITFFCDLSENGTGNESNDGQNLPANWIGWPDVAAYADWAGLRPATELEFEKAARGPNNAVLHEFAWGNISICSSSYSLVNSGTASESISGSCTATGNAVYYGTTTSTLGVLRCGIISASVTNKTRTETGAGYYGVMELSGNAWELLVSIGVVAGRSYTGLHGNGILNPAGDADVNHWPGINGNQNQNAASGTYGGTTGVTRAAGAGYKFGQIASPIDHLWTSDRSLASYNHYERDLSIGGRLVRTAP